MFYYTVNGNRYFNPYLAWHEKFKSNLPIEFHCNDLEYSAIDWTREPVESFDTLMDRHAKHVRNKYERLIFFWSGGTDSQTVLNVFVRNRIRIDEIVCQANKRLPWYPTRHIDWLKEHYWDKTTKITLVAIKIKSILDENSFKLFSSKSDGLHNFVSISNIKNSLSLLFNK